MTSGRIWKMKGSIIKGKRMVIKKIKEITLNEALSKLKKAFIALAVINVVVLFISAYCFILFGASLSMDRSFALIVVTMSLSFGVLILEVEEY